MNVDDLPYFFIRYLKVKVFWLHWFYWLNNLCSIVIRNSQVIEECILFGFPSNRDVMQVLKFVDFMQNIISIANVYLIITHLTMPAWINSRNPWKQKKKYIKKIIRKKDSPSKTLSMRICKAIMKILYVIMHLRLCIHYLK